MFYEETKQLKNGKWKSFYYEDDYCMYASDEWESELLAKAARMEWKIKKGMIK